MFQKKLIYIVGLNDEISVDSQVLTRLMKISIKLNWVRIFDKTFFQNS